MKELYLIRHGRTEANDKKIYCGNADVPLSTKGKEELLELKENIIYPNCDLYITSGLIRANETLEIIKPNVKYLKYDSLQEYNFGEFTFKNYEDLKDDDSYKKWISDDTGDVSCPNGEDRNGFKKRILTGINEIIEKYKKHDSVFIVCHGGVIATLMEIFFEGERNFYEWHPKNGNGYKIIFSHNVISEYSSLTFH